RLVPRIDGSGVLPAVEVLVNNDRIKDMIAKPDRIHEIPTAIEESFESFGMRTFDQSLMDLLSRGLISYDTAIANASRPGLFDLRASGISSMGGEKKWGQFEKAGEVALKEEAARREKSLRTEKTKTTTRTRGTGSWFSSAKSAADDATTASSATGGSLRLPPPSRSSSARIVEREYRPGSPAGSAREETVAFDIETASGLRPTRSGRRRSSSSRSRAYVPDDNRDLNVWLLSSLFGIFTGFFIWWATNRPPQTEPALRGEPARTYSSSRAKSAFNSKSKLKSRKPASLKRAKPARDE
ncbi:MAG TPA: hypothetical protein VFV50_01985, partial [Bdellovibrionales bacterium]|nr:hypothetical protein [Bdellovibrionales bacterium]